MRGIRLCRLRSTQTRLRAQLGYCCQSLVFRNPQPGWSTHCTAVLWEATVPEARDWEAEAMQDWEEALVDTTALQAVVVEEGLGLVGEAAVVLAEEDLG